ncbi:MULTISPECIES: hypothetical protein [unclassified Methylophilus]|jgi:hypothetical protein|uniref:hypothetical protein n=1 Tax=unclassified Methylophilus TaxID=2630143 RepID=UPI0003632F1E|nr:MULTISPECIES: hypothetical protein [unclassified Methylophilus]
MTSDLWNIFLNVVAAFIYAGIVWLWQNRAKKKQLPTQPPPTSAPISGNEPTDRRARNLQALEAGTQAFLFYLVTFAALYLSITMPALFKALFAKEPVLLSQARYIGEFLPSIPIGKDYLQISFFVVAAVIYWPLLILSEAIMSLLYPLVDAFRPVTKRIWNAITMLVFLVFCIPVAATSIWLFYEKSYTDSLLTVLFFIFLAFALGQAQGGRR